MIDKTEKIEAVERSVAETKNILDSALKRLHDAVSGVIVLSETAGVCPYTEHKCPLWDELARLRANQRNGH